MRIKLGLVIFWASLIALHLACQSGTDTPPPGPTPISAGTWTWVSGGNTARQPGVYGIKGVADPANVPRARDSAVSWIDANGKFWIFGGSWNWVLSYTYYNDLWNYSPASGEWTWVSGSDVDGQFGIYGTRSTSDPSNVPGARRSAASWRDLQGNLWLFGGYGRDWANYNGELNDLWKFDPATLEWTWMSGSENVNQPPVYGTKGVTDPSNVPGARAKSASWVNLSGRFWLFGGIEKAVYTSNDLWMYDLATLEWTWVAGGNTGFQKGVYGTKGQADPLNTPGSRVDAVTWVDAGGKLWLFGGEGIDGFDNPGLLNDLWRFDPATGLWTWVSGGNAINHKGTYGTRGLAGSANIPGGRQSGATWIDSTGKLWLFGGFGYDSVNSTGWLNDLWKFDPAALQWTWVSGSIIYGQNGNYGTLGTPASTNIPGTRAWAVSQIDSSGRLWLFGGLSYDSVGSGDCINDLWRYTR